MTENLNLLQEQLYSAVLVDILDELGYRNQGMDHTIRPVDPSFKIVGYAFTILATDVYEIPKEPYKKELQAIDELKQDHVVVATTNGSTSSGFWGELLSTAAQVKGSRGAVIDGLTRDSEKIREIGYPVFARGYSPYDSKGRTDVIDYNVPIKCGNILVFPGDLVFADHDGIAVVPKQLIEPVLQKALEKVNGENEMRKALQNGMGVVSAFNKYGIL
ncbi:RraA family protein [Fredinandcohnia sp. QZ13]|uniref:RraA family protein n=1 Tax=Fredinandcohnia sp. QZ13 TaxID=3073144 RepID=UPI00285336B3|nr:RraA family protein [Fredinandcohnia sp. QZ13]MDR4887491.1 RraA family protein [Fredinandcohnia sp. QZ13]